MDSSSASHYLSFGSAPSLAVIIHPHIQYHFPVVCIEYLPQSTQSQKAAMGIPIPTKKTVSAVLLGFLHARFILSNKRHWSTIQSVGVARFGIQRAAMLPTHAPTMMLPLLFPRRTTSSLLCVCLSDRARVCSQKRCALFFGRSFWYGRQTESKKYLEIFVAVRTREIRFPTSLRQILKATYSNNSVVQHSFKLGVNYNNQMMSIVVVVLKELSKTMCTNVQRKNRG
jgi:hypothetical protein